MAANGGGISIAINEVGMGGGGGGGGGVSSSQLAVSR